jgi:hypothetical protein
MGDILDGAFSREYDIFDVLIVNGVHKTSCKQSAGANGMKMMLSHVRNADRQWENQIMFTYINPQNDSSLQRGLTIKKEEIVDYALTKETTETTYIEWDAIRITPKRFIIDTYEYSNKGVDDKIWTLSIIFLNPGDRDKLKTFLDKEPSVNDATNTTESTIDRPNLIVGGKIMKYKLNKKSKSILSNRLSKRRKIRRKRSKRRKISKRRQISKWRTKSKRYQ